MSYIWTFAPENKALLQSCLSAVPPPDVSNKWLQKFGPRNLDLINETVETITLNDSPDIEDNRASQVHQDEEISNAADEFLDPEVDLLSKFNYLVEKCRQTPKLLGKLAETLPTSAAEKLMKHVLNTEGLNKDFLVAFYKYFLHKYIRRENSRFCSNVLLQSYNKYPQYLKIALELILKDLEILNNVVNDFIINLTAKNQTNLLENLSEIEFNAEEFSHNLFNIYTAYKSCNKTDNIQNYILSCLNTFCDICSSDKHYGKLMLAFLQHENSIKRNGYCIIMEGLIERHKSPFKRPCLSLLNELKDKK